MNVGFAAIVPCCCHVSSHCVSYTIIGNFQDLNHSGVNYTIEELEERRNICLSVRLCLGLAHPC